MVRGATFPERRIFVLLSGQLNPWLQLLDGSGVMVGKREAGEAFLLGRLRQPYAAQRHGEVLSDHAEILITPRFLLSEVCGVGIAEEILADLAYLRQEELVLLKAVRSGRGQGECHGV